MARRTAPSSSATARRCARCKGNLEHLDLGDRSRVIAGDAMAHARTLDVDLVLADPPYQFDDWLTLLQSITAPFVVAEAGRSLEELDGAEGAGWRAVRAAATAAPG